MSCQKIHPRIGDILAALFVLFVLLICWIVLLFAWAVKTSEAQDAPKPKLCSVVAVEWRAHNEDHLSFGCSQDTNDGLILVQTMLPNGVREDYFTIPYGDVIRIMPLKPGEAANDNK